MEAIGYKEHALQSIMKINYSERHNMYIYKHVCMCTCMFTFMYIAEYKVNVKHDVNMFDIR